MMLSLGYMCPLYVVDVGFSLLPNKEQLVQTSPPMHHLPQIRKFQTHFLHQWLIGDSSLCWWIDGIQEQVKFKKFLLEISRCKLLRWSCRFFYLAWFTCLSIKWIAASENVQRHSAFLNEAIPSFKPFICIFQMQAVLDIYFLGGRCVCWRIISILALIWMYYIP